MTLELRSVTKRYGDKMAVDNVTLEVPQGELLVLIGPSGCGKTTTLKMINRLVEPDSGQVIVDGVDVSGQSQTQLRRRIGYVIQQVGLFPHMNVADNVAAVPQLLKWDKKRIAARVEELLDLVGLPASDYARAWPGTLSGGEAQRVGVARALAADPPVLLMDEPFGAVDPLTREVLQREFLRIQSTLGKTVVFVTHDLDEAIRLGDRIAVMNEGKLVAAEVPGKLLMDSNPFIRDFTGDDRALRRLARISVGEAMGSGIAGDSLDFMNNSCSDNTPDGSICSDSSLKDALSSMLESGESSLDALNADGKTMGRLTLKTLLDTASGREDS